MAWKDPVYLKTVLIVLAVLFGSGGLVYSLRRKNYYFVSAWASIKSWIFLAPVLFILFGLPEPGPLIVLAIFGVYGAKAFFQILGMFHRWYFVITCYAGIFGLALCAYFGQRTLYDLMPMIVLGVSCLIPIFVGSFRRMLQYISLTLLGFIFLGWSFMHLALVLQFSDGLYQILYLVVLTEFCDNTNLATSYYFRGPRMFPGIDPKRTYLSTLVSIVLTITLAGIMRSLLPGHSEHFWMEAGFIASIGGLFGDLVMTMIRRDAGVKDVGPFILGRGDLLQRMDRLIFVAPIYYYVMLGLSGTP